MQEKEYFPRLRPRSYAKAVLCVPWKQVLCNPRKAQALTRVTKIYIWNTWVVCTQQQTEVYDMMHEWNVRCRQNVFIRVSARICLITGGEGGKRDRKVYVCSVYVCVCVCVTEREKKGRSGFILHYDRCQIWGPTKFRLYWRSPSKHTYSVTNSNSW